MDLVACNPPYIVPEDLEGLPADVRAEPVLALVGGIDLYVSLADQAAAWLRPGGALVVEIEESAGPSVRSVLEGAGFGDVEVRRDLAGRDRVVVGRWP